MARELKGLSCIIQGGDCQIHIQIDGKNTYVTMEMDGRTVVTIIKSANQEPVVSTDLVGIRATLDERGEDWPFTIRTRNCLKNANITYVGELVQQSGNDLLKIKNFGRRSLAEVKELLAMKGLALGMHLKDWVRPDKH